MRFIQTRQAKQRGCGKGDISWAWIDPSGTVHEVQGDHVSWATKWLRANPGWEVPSDAQDRMAELARWVLTEKDMTSALGSEILESLGWIRVSNWLAIEVWSEASVSHHAWAALGQLMSRCPTETPSLPIDNQSVIFDQIGVKKSGVLDLPDFLSKHCGRKCMNDMYQPALKALKSRVATMSIWADASKSKCMECALPPTHECVWADGRARAWHCDKHWKAFQAKDAQEKKDKTSYMATGELPLAIIKDRAIKGGVAGKKYGEEPKVKATAKTANKHISLMKFLSQVATRIGAGDAAYIVGGAVRNWVLGQEIKDIDVVVDQIALGHDTMWFAEHLAKAIPAKTSLVTNQYGVAILSVSSSWVLDGYDMQGETIEVAPARKESYGEQAVKNYKPKVEPSGIVEDTARRDFTFNTLMWRLSDLANGPDHAAILDILGCGLDDLKRGDMRCPGNDPDKTFADDPTRLIRCVKFLVKYDLKPTPDTEAAIRRNADKLKNVPHGAVSKLMLDIVLGGGKVGRSLLEMDRLGLLDVIKEMIQTIKPFKEALVNWADAQPVQVMFDLMDLGLPLATRIGFLSQPQQDRLRQIVAALDQTDALSLLAILKQPGKVLDTQSIMSEFNLKGPEIGKMTEVARAAILDKPELATQHAGLTQAVREALSGGRVAVRHIANNIFEAPPALVKAITDWAVPLVEDYYAQSEDARQAIWYKDRTFPIDLQGWKYEKTVLEGSVRTCQQDIILLQRLIKQAEQMDANVQASIDGLAKLGIVHLGELQVRLNEPQVQALAKKYKWQVKGNFVRLGPQGDFNFPRLDVSPAVVNWNPAAAEIRRTVEPVLFKVRMPVGKGPYSPGKFLPQASVRGLLKRLTSCAIKPIKPLGITVTLHFRRGPKGVAGQWQAATRELFLEIGNGLTVADLPLAIRHECQHVGQTLLQDALRLSTPGGLPPKNVRDTTTFSHRPPKNSPVWAPPPERKTETHGTHDSLDVEFHTEMADAVGNFDRQTGRTPEEFINNAIFFNSLKVHPAKYALAVKMFMKAIKAKVPASTKTATMVKRIAGWWAIDPKTGKMVPPPIDKGPLLNAVPGTDPWDVAWYLGDGPLDALGDAIYKMESEYLAAWGRHMTPEELQAAWKFSVGNMAQTTEIPWWFRDTRCPIDHPAYQADSIAVMSSRVASMTMDASIADAWLKWVVQPFNIIVKHHSEFVSGPIDDAMDAIIKEIAPRLVKRLGEHEVEEDLTEFQAGAFIGRAHALANQLADPTGDATEGLDERTQDEEAGYAWGFNHADEWDGKTLPTVIRRQLVQSSLSDFKHRVTEEVVTALAKKAWGAISPLNTVKEVIHAVKTHGWKVGVYIALFEAFEHTVLPSILVALTHDARWYSSSALPIGELVYAIVFKMLGRVPKNLDKAEPDGHLDWYEYNYGTVKLAYVAPKLGPKVPLMTLPDAKVTYRVKIDGSDGILAAVYYGTTKIALMDAYRQNAPEEAKCGKDVLTLFGQYPEIEDTRWGRHTTRDGIEHPRIRALHVYGANILDESKQGLGIGKAMYQAVMAEWFDQVGPFLFMPDECAGVGTTSAMARHVWDSLAKMYPSSGRVIAVLRRPVLPAGVRSAESCQGTSMRKRLTACNDPNAPDKIRKLWMLLDDIDTASDIAKSNDGLYRNLVHDAQAARFDVVSGDEIDVLLDAATERLGRNASSLGIWVNPQEQHDA